MIVRAVLIICWLHSARVLKQIRTVLVTTVKYSEDDVPCAQLLFAALVLCASPCNNAAYVSFKFFCGKLW